MNKEKMKRWVPYVATGAGMLLLGLILGATLFGGDPEPCVEMSKPAMVEAFSAPAERFGSVALGDRPAICSGSASATRSWSAQTLNETMRCGGWPAIADASAPAASSSMAQSACMSLFPIPESSRIAVPPQAGRL